ncbi:unnamed protein product, partial [Prorocentrum cordatum]
GEGGGSSGARSSQAPLVCASLPPRVPAAALLQGGRSPQARLAARDPWSRRGPASPGAWEEPDIGGRDSCICTRGECAGRVTLTSGRTGIPGVGNLHRHPRVVKGRTTGRGHAIEQSVVPARRPRRRAQS